MSISSKEIGERLADLINGWQTEAPAASFAGKTLDEFKLAVKSSVDRRAEITTLETQLLVKQDNRDDADKVTWPLVLQVVNSIKGDVAYGEDSALYEAIGYVRKSERQTGKTNKPKPATPPTP